jgi:hypothetical protein
MRCGKRMLGLRYREAVVLNFRVDVVMLVAGAEHGRVRLRSACSAKREGTSCIFSRYRSEEPGVEIDGVVRLNSKTALTPKLQKVQDAREARQEIMLLAIDVLHRSHSLVQPCRFNVGITRLLRCEGARHERTRRV